MQGTENHLPFESYPFSLPQETDTATPRTLIPIYYIHEGSKPFCGTPTCFCQRGKRAAAELYNEMKKGRVQLAQVAAGMPQDCAFYGHSWQATDHPDVKVCLLCHIRGYCPGCSPTPIDAAKPFTCTYHAQRQVQE